MQLHAIYVLYTCTRQTCIITAALCVRPKHSGHNAAMGRNWHDWTTSGHHCAGAQPSELQLPESVERLVPAMLGHTKTPIHVCLFDVVLEENCTIMGLCCGFIYPVSIQFGSPDRVPKDPKTKHCDSKGP